MTARTPSPSGSSAASSSYNHPDTPRKRGNPFPVSRLSHDVTNSLPSRRDDLLQRLFSTFPDGPPGLGLLCLRLGAGIALLQYGVAGLSGVMLGGPVTVAPDVIAAVAGILLLAGLWTPIAGAVVAIMELGIGVLAKSDPSIHLLLAVLGAGLAMLGPGAWSVDARLFGRKRLNVRDRIRAGSVTPLK